MKDICSSQKELAAELALPIEHIRVSKELGYDGGKYNNWKPEHFSEWYQKNKPLIEAFLKDDVETDSNTDEAIKQEKLKILRINREAMEGKTLDKEKVLAIARGVLDAQSIILQTRKQELALKCVGLDANGIAKEVGLSDDKFLSMLEEQIGKWIVERKVG